MFFKRKQTAANDKTPDFIQNYILEYDHHLRNETELLKIEAAKTKYNEWIVIAVEENTYGDVHVWMTNFINKKIKNMFPMYLNVDDKSSALKIYDLKVLDNDRSKGYGSLFMKTLFEIVETREIMKISGWVERPEDPTLVDFYKKFGISIVGTNLHWEREINHSSKNN